MSSKKRSNELVEDVQQIDIEPIVRGIISSSRDMEVPEDEIVEHLRKKVIKDFPQHLEPGLQRFSSLSEESSVAESTSIANLNELKELIKENPIASDIYDNIIKKQLLVQITKVNEEKIIALEMCANYFSQAVGHVKKFGRVVNPQIIENDIAKRSFSLALKPDNIVRRELSVTSEGSSNTLILLEDDNSTDKTSYGLISVAKRFGLF
jgi:hypothetical protein